MWKELGVAVHITYLATMAYWIPETRLSVFLIWGLGLRNAESSCSEVGCLRLQVLQVFLPLHSLYIWPHLRHPQHSALSWAKFFRSERGIFVNFMHISWQVHGCLCRTDKQFVCCYLNLVCFHYRRLLSPLMNQSRKLSSKNFLCPVRCTLFFREQPCPCFLLF